MNLDDVARFRELDTEDMRSHIDLLPDQLKAAWVSGQQAPLPESFRQIERVVIIGVGTSSLVGDMLAALVADRCSIPIIVQCGYTLPVYAQGSTTLVIGISHTGDDEETTAALETAASRGARLAALTMGGALAQVVTQAGGLVWTYQYKGPDRAALGWSFGLLLALVSRLGLVRDVAQDVTETVDMLRSRIPILGIDGPVVKNPAKRLAGQMIGRIPVIYGGGILAPVARRWKTQINENGKSWAQWEPVPEISRNALAGIHFPPPLMTKVAVVMLVAPASDHPRLAMQQELIKTLYLQDGVAMDVVKARGSSLLAQLMSCIQFGDYVSYYVAMAYEADPTPTMAIDELKAQMAAATKPAQS